MLDVGCGTGENSLYLIARGHPVWGIDISSRAIDLARAKARSRGLLARFLVWDATELHRLDQVFDTVIDSGLFHSLADEQREPFRSSLERVLRRGGSYLILCFSEHEPGEWGPRRISQEEIRETFRGWTVNFIRETRMETNLSSEGARAWLASLSPPVTLEEAR